MAKRVVDTTVCGITVNGRLAGSPGPALLCIRGIWAPTNHLDELIDAFPEHDVLIGDIPGMWSPPPPTSNPTTFAQAYDELVDQLFPDRPVAVLGVSTGALIALGLRSPQVRARVVVEPFFSTASVWPLIDNMQARIRAHPTCAPYVEQIFGITAEAVQDRDFSHLLDGLTGPLFSIFGSLPLGERRAIDTWPSLANDAARGRLTEIGRVYQGPPGTGHALTEARAGIALVAQVTRQALQLAEPD